jgi:hypothetical protein
VQGSQLIDHTRYSGLGSNIRYRSAIKDAAALKGQVDIEKGQVMQSNFADYQMLKATQSSLIFVRIFNSGAEMVTVSGQRIRSLPMMLS